MTRRSPSRANYLAFVFCVLLGAAAAGWGFIVLEKQKASFQWPATSGSIVQADRVIIPAHGSLHYRADVMYSYKINGARYVSRQISLWSADLEGYDSISKPFVEAHTAGMDVAVYYDPKNPANAVLLPGANEKLNELMMGWGGFLLVLGIVGIVACYRQEPRLAAVLNAPDAQTRTVQMRRDDIEKGINGMLINLMIGMCFLVFAIGLLLPPFLTGPAIMLEAQHKVSPSLSGWGIACLGGFIVCLVIGARKSRSADCPVCRNFLNKKTFSTHQCSRCGTRIIFEGESAPTVPTTAMAPVAHGTVHATGTREHQTTIGFQFQKDKFIDITGLVAFPTLYSWLWVALDKDVGHGVAVLFTILFLILGCVYYFYPKSLGALNSRSSKKAQEPDDKKSGPYALDSSIILSPLVGLVVYLLYLTWQHQRPGKTGSIGLVIGFPVAVGIATYVWKVRSDRADKLKLPQPPGFVSGLLVGLWLVGFFVWILFVTSFGALMFRL